MKKILSLILLAALLLPTVPAVKAATRSCPNQSACPTVQEHCDVVYSNRCEDCGKTFVDEDNDGVCDNRSNGCGRAFVEKNNGGICYNRRQDSQPKAAQGHHSMGRHGR